MTEDVSANPKSQLLRTISLKAGPAGPKSQLEIQTGSVTVFIGPNHSGKSKLLQEIRDSMVNGNRCRALKVLNGLQFNPIEKGLREQYQKEIQEASEKYNRDE